MSDQEQPTDDSTEAERAAERAYWEAEDARHEAAEAWLAERFGDDEEDGEEPSDLWLDGRW